MTWTHSFLDLFLHFVPRDLESVLDAGCGRGIVGALARIYREPNRVVGIDGFDPYLQFCRRTGMYDQLIEHDLRKFPLPFKSDEFDLATSLEVIEHLPKEDGVRLLEELERVSRMVIVSTPNRFFRQDPYDDNPFQSHISRWRVSDFFGRGYSVYGAGGLLILGKEIPMLSYALARFTIPFPRLSGTLLCAYSRTSHRRASFPIHLSRLAPLISRKAGYDSTRQ